MKTSTWATIALVVVFTLGAVTALAITDRAEQAQTSAATSITRFLLAVIGLAVVAAVGAVVGWRWLQGYQERQKMQRAIQQAQVYAALQGARPPAGRTARPSTPAQPGGNVFILPGGQQTTPVQHDTGPSNGGWEVVQ